LEYFKENKKLKEDGHIQSVQKTQWNSYAASVTDVHSKDYSQLLLLCHHFTMTLRRRTQGKTSFF